MNMVQRTMKIQSMIQIQVMKMSKQEKYELIESAKEKMLKDRRHNMLTHKKESLLETRHAL